VGAAHDRRQLHQLHGGIAGVEDVPHPPADRQAAGMGQDHARFPVGRRLHRRAPPGGRAAGDVAGDRAGEPGPGTARRACPSGAPG
ncbi:hypothetical protein FD64_15115, partial [Staphylococcus aureus]